MDSVSIALGLLGIFLWPMPLGGLLVGAGALALGIMTLRHRKSSLAVAGSVLGGIALVVTVVNWRIGLLDLILRQYFQY